MGAVTKARLTRVTDPKGPGQDLPKRKGVEIMKANIGSIDRTVRIVLGLAIIAGGLATHNWLGVIGLVLLATAAVGTCPLYLPFGISTRKDRKQTAGS